MAAFVNFNGNEDDETCSTQSHDRSQTGQGRGPVVA
jgi:hypothetical protein